MTKIMLVEDDKNLSSIYRDRLLAEGYDIVSAHDGEEALAMAVKEKPNLIIADVMMPKISGFDMLDILRSTPETKNTRVIMMTALSQAENQQRATQLGADKYLVKSQVTLDDIARVVKEVLEDGGMSQIENPITMQTTTSSTESTTSSEQLVNNVTENSQQPTAPAIDALPAESAAVEKNEIENEIQKLAEGIPSSAPDEVLSDNNPNPVTPQTNATNELKPDIMALYEKEMENEMNQNNTPDQNTQPNDPHSSISL